MTAHVNTHNHVMLIVLSFLLVVGVIVMSPIGTDPAEGAAIYDFDVTMTSTYVDAQQKDSAVGETRPALPIDPTLPSANPLPPNKINGVNATGGVFTFAVSCATTGANCDTNPPDVEWDFGDGTVESSAVLTAEHAYTTPGVYTVRASLARGDWVGEARRTVYVSPHFTDIKNVIRYSETILNPVLYWRMDDTSGVTAADSSSTGTHGTYAGSPALNQDGAITAEGTAASGGNIAVSFDGIDDSAFISAPGVQVYGNVDNAVEGWIKIPTLPTSDVGILSLGPAIGGGALTWTLTPGGQIRVATSGGNSAVVSVPVNTWFHFATSYEAGATNPLLSIYLNGSQARIYNPGMAVNLDGSLRIGRGQDGTGYFAGLLDEIAVYGRQLTVSELSTRTTYTGTSPVTSTRDDRESIWTVGALDIFEICSVASQGLSSSVEKGRALFCPEPVTPDALPANIPMPAAATANGVTEEVCTDWWGACNLPKEMFDTALGPATVANVTALITAGKLDASNVLVYDPLNCGDGWTAVSDGAGGWQIVEGSEDGCLSRADWYKTLIGAVDGYIAASPSLSADRLVSEASTATCLDIANAEAYDSEGSFAYRRALALGLTTPTLRTDAQTGSGPQCDISAGILKGEMYASLSYVLGIIDPVGICQGVSAGSWKDLVDEDLLANGLPTEYPDCGRVVQSVNQQTPLVGDLACYWGVPGAGFCFNPYDPVSRGDAAIVLAGTITQEAQIAGDLIVDLTQDGPKPVGSTITVTAVGRAPLSKYGDFQFVFAAANTTNAVAQCGTGTVTVPSVVVGDERRAVATCSFVMNAEVTTDVTVTLSIPTLGTGIGQSSIAISASNAAPELPIPSTMATVTEGENSIGSTVFSAFDREGTTLSFEIARDATSPWMGVNGPVGSYNVVVLSDSPMGYWRLDEPTGSAVGDASGNGYVGVKQGLPTQGVAGIFGVGGGANTAYRFTGTPDRVDVIGLPVDITSTGVTTAEFWMNWDGIDGIPLAFNNYRLRITDGFLGFQTSGTKGLYGFDAQGLNNEWAYVVAEFHNDDYTKNRLWINGVEQNLNLVINDTMPLALTVGSTLYIGGGPAGGYFQGVIDEVGVYNGVLTQQQIRDHYSYGLDRVVVENTQGRDVAGLYLTPVSVNSVTVNLEVLDRNTNGNYSFLLRAFDGDKYSPVQTVTGTITAIQDAPLGTAGRIISDTSYEGGPAVILNLAGADPDDYGWAGFLGGVTRYRLSSGPAKGTLEYDSDDGVGTLWTPYTIGTADFANPSLRYTPEIGPYGDGTFNVGYEVLDTGYPTPVLWSATRIAQIFVINTNDPPVCLDIVTATDEDVSKLINFACSDPENDVLTYDVVSLPVNAILTGTGGSRTFVPAANWNGVTTYTYRAFDGQLYSGTQTVTVTVNSINDVPTIPTGAMPTQNEDTTPVGTFSTSDVDAGPNWTFYISDNASTGFVSTSKALAGKGTLTVNQGALTNLTASVSFNNNANWCGTYTFYIKSYDGISYSPVKTVTSTMTCVNDAPTTPTGTMPIQNEDVNVAAIWYTTDPDGTAWTFQISASPTSGFSSSSVALSGKGTLSVNNVTTSDKGATITFNNNANWCGTYTFYVRVWDGAAYSGVSTESAGMTCVNDVPAVPAAAGFVNILEDQTVTKTYTTSDPDSARWCIQYKQWSAYTGLPANAATCSTSTTATYTYTMTGARGKMTITQGSLTDKAATITYKPNPNYVTAGTGPTLYVRFCDSNGACSGWRYETFSVLNNHDDLIVVTPNGTKHRWWLNSSLIGTWTWSPTWEFTASRMPVSGDWDGDGIDNFLIYLTSNGGWYREYNLATQPSIGWNAGTTNMVPFGGDWDADNDDDFAYYNNTNGYVYLRDNDTGGVTSWRDTGFMYTGLEPGGGDADADGKDEVFFWDNDNDAYSTTGQWHIVEPVANGADTVAPFSYGYCLVCGNALVGDWNGNGVETIGVYYTYDGRVYARNSNSGGGSNYAKTYNANYTWANGFDNPNK